MSKTEQEQSKSPKPKSRVPRFTTVEQAAEFWDTHSVADFEDELEPVNDVRFVVMRGRPKKPLTVRLPEETLETLTEQAHQLGVGPSTLIRMWVIEHLAAERKSHPR